MTGNRDTRVWKHTGPGLKHSNGAQRSTGAEVITKIGHTASLHDMDGSEIEAPKAR
jgi:hypothetical protein